MTFWLVALRINHLCHRIPTEIGKTHFKYKISGNIDLLANVQLITTNREKYMQRALNKPSNKYTLSNILISSNKM
jgi:hypothetical protein